MDGSKNPLGLIVRSQALFEAFAIPERLPIIDPKWFNNIVLDKQGRVRVHAWLGKGPVSHQLDHLPLLFFDHGEETYPSFEFPSAGPRGAALKQTLVKRDINAGADTAIFCIEAALVVGVPSLAWEQAVKNDLNAAQVELVQKLQMTAKDIQDTLTGAYALYQYPLVWRPLHEQHTYLFINPDTQTITSSFQRLQPDNFIPFRLDASSRIRGNDFEDAVMKQAAAIVDLDIRIPFVFLKDSMWHADIRTRFLLQFWIIEYLSERHSSTPPKDQPIRELVRRLDEVVSVEHPDMLNLFRARKGELLRRTLAEKVGTTCGALRIQYDDRVFKRAKKVRDNLSHGSAYDDAELAEMERYIRELSRLMIRRELESRGVFLAGDVKPLNELPLVRTMFIDGESKRREEASFSIEIDDPSRTGPPLNRVPSRDQIAERAYQLYERRGLEHGHDLEDWFQAERELTPVPQS